MHRELIAYLSLTALSLLAIWITGALVVFTVFDDRISLPEFIGFSYLTGTGMTAALLGLSSLVLGRFYPSFVYACMLLAGIISLILLIRGKRLHLRETTMGTGRLRYYEYLLLLPVVFIIAVMFIGGISGAPNWDGLLIYGFMAKSLFLSHHINMGFFTDAARYGRIHLDYPLLLPLLEYWCYHFIGIDNEQVIQLLTIGYYLALACIFYGALRHTLSRTPALAALLILLFNPILISNSVSGDADIIIAAYLTGILVLYAKLFARPSLKTALLLGMLAGFLANAKNEGFAFFVLFSLLLLFLPGKTRKTYVYYFIPAALFGLPWFITKLLYGIKSDLFVNLSGQVSLIKDRLPVMLDYSYHFFTGTGSQVKGTGLLWLVVLTGGMVTLVYSSVRKKYGELWIPFILMLFVYCAVYMITPHSIQWQMELSFSRTMSQVMPPLLWLSTVVLWERFTVRKPDHE